MAMRARSATCAGSIDGSAARRSPTSRG
ncbi:hypothetical protein FHR89_000793 [Cellulomonas uda]|nr:hypothetical protein [Cellulomonas uda]